jgi:hypothetical protein
MKIRTTRWPSISPPGPGLPDLDGNEIGLLEKFAWLGVPVPKAVARLLASHGDSATELTPAPQGDSAAKLPLAGQEGDARLGSLLKKRCLLESKDRQTVGLAVPGGKAAGSARRKNELLAWLAANSDWAYARVAHFIASDQPAALERYLEKQALESPAQVARGPAFADDARRQDPGIFC